MTEIKNVKFPHFAARMIGNKIVSFDVVGETVTVRYDASDPSRAEIASSTAVKVLGGSALLLFSGVGVAAGWLLLRLRGKSGGTAPHAPRD